MVMLRLQRSGVMYVRAAKRRLSRDSVSFSACQSVYKGLLSLSALVVFLKSGTQWRILYFHVILKQCTICNFITP